MTRPVPEVARPEAPAEVVPPGLARIAEFFPHVMTEALSPDGDPVPAVDFDLLRQELSGHLVDGPSERYRLDWPGRRASLLAANSPPAATLRPAPGESVGADTTGNLFVEGDNLDVLKLLSPEYRGRVRMIYIDPPYNTGNDFVYADDFAHSSAEYRAAAGRRAASVPTDDGGGPGCGGEAEPDSDGRFHAGWLSMMYPRLRLARELLAEDGVGFVSIGGFEVAPLKLLLAEVFGAGNVVATIVWANNLKGRQLGSGGPAGTHEYILCFARDAAAISQFRGSASEFRELMPAVYRGVGYQVKHDARGAYVTKNELFNTNSRFNEQTAPTMVFRIHYHPGSGDVRVSDIDDPSSFPGYLTAMPHPNARPGVRWHAWRWSRARILADHPDLEFDATDGRLRIRTKIRDVDGMVLKDLVVGPSTATGQADLAALGLARLFDNPKPVALIRTLVKVATTGDDLVLDFFAGSATTAQAVMEANAADGGRRRFVLVQLDEPPHPASEAARAGYTSIAQLSRERIRRAGRVIIPTAPGVDVGFRALRAVPIASDEVSGEGAW